MLRPKSLRLFCLTLALSKLRDLLMVFMVAEDKLFKISDYIKEGKVTDLSQNNSIIIGKGLADKMMLTVGIL
jgi:ABC-type lipoprotein release transport system permease subunit